MVWNDASGGADQAITDARAYSGKAIRGAIRYTGHGHSRTRSQVARITPILEVDRFLSKAEDGDEVRPTNDVNSGGALTHFDRS